MKTVKITAKIPNKIVMGVLTLSLLSGCVDPVAQIKTLLGIEPTPVAMKPLPKSVKDEMNAVGDAPKQTAGELAKENSELLAEMYNVVFDQKDAESKDDFGNMVHTLDQGASLEGVYRGIVAGSKYRSLEAKSQAAGPTELKAFAIEMAELQDTMKSPTTFDADAKKAPSIQYPDGDNANANPNAPVAQGDSQAVTPKKDKATNRDELLETFLGASTYTLKRTLGDEALKKFDEMKDDRGGLAQWYANFVIRMAASKVDFGLALRSQPDFDFHFKFAQKMAIDRVKWEVLNRYHRYLNFTATQTQ